MLYYCLKCKKNTESINPIVSKTNNGKTMKACVLYAMLKKQNLLKNKKPMEYLGVWVLEHLQVKIQY